jgi:hypothetical protein
MKEEKGAQLYLRLCTHLRTQLHLMVGTQLLLLLLNLQAFSCHRPFTGKLNKTTAGLFPCLQDVADCPLGKAITM